MQAIFLNRFRDFCLFHFLLCETLFLRFFRVLAKSSIIIFCSWLPNAIERPTPVSSLLHSSTIVVAGVFLLSFLGLLSRFFGLLTVFYGTFIGLIGRFFKDFKRIIAFSTSSQLGLIGLFFAGRHFLASMSYVYVHAFFKARLFIFCGLSIHGIDSQLSKFFSNSILRSRSNFLLLVIVRTPFLSVAFLKDPFLLGNSCLTALFALFFRVSTLFYSFKLFKFFRVSGVYLIFRRFLFFTLTFLSSANFLELRALALHFSQDISFLWRIFFASAYFIFYPLFLGEKTFAVEFFRKLFVLRSLSLREQEVKNFLRFRAIALFLL
jgi:NADH:ubiquinone oxidoreductase subunit 5 (subunit L)/multisubunit Na+/H+ antiporter MnhA subunit